MPLAPGYYYLQLGGFTFPINPTRCTPFVAEKLSVDIKTLSGTVVQHFDIYDSDKLASYEFENIDTTSMQTLKSLYESSYQSLDFYDEYNNHHLVVMVKFPSPQRRSFLDSNGWSINFDLRKVG